jgi:hypothetical protein
MDHVMFMFMSFIFWMWNDRQLDLLIICVESVIQVHFAGPPPFFLWVFHFTCLEESLFSVKKKSEETHSVFY